MIKKNIDLEEEINKILTNPNYYISITTSINTPIINYEINKSLK